MVIVKSHSDTHPSPPSQIGSLSMPWTAPALSYLKFALICIAFDSFSSIIHCILAIWGLFSDSWWYRWSTRIPVLDLPVLLWATIVCLLEQHVSHLFDPCLRSIHHVAVQETQSRKGRKQYLTFSFCTVLLWYFIGVCVLLLAIYLIPFVTWF